MNLFDPPGSKTSHWVTFEGQTLARAQAGLDNSEAKGHAFESFVPGETKTLLDVRTRGTIRRIWMTVSDRTPEMLSALTLKMYWDDSRNPAVSCPLGDFFGLAFGRTARFESALFSSPEGRSFNCFIPMPFRTAAKIQLTNESSSTLSHFFYEIDLLQEPVAPDALYFHAVTREDHPNRLGQEFGILRPVKGIGRFLGCNVGVVTDPAYDDSWWGEGEVKIRLGNDDHPTLCGTGAEDYVGTGWGLGTFAHRTQGCLVADGQSRTWCFYRYHLEDPVYFTEGCQVAIQTIGGWPVHKVLALQSGGASLIPVTVDHRTRFVRLLDGQPVSLRDPEFSSDWCNFWRQDRWRATAYLFLSKPELPAVHSAQE